MTSKKDIEEAIRLLKERVVLTHDTDTIARLLRQIAVETRKLEEERQPKEEISDARDP